MSADARERFARTADRVAARQDAGAERLAEQLARFVALSGDERALDVGTGAGALAIALAPRVREVVAVDVVPELLAEARKRIPANVELVEADATALPFPPGSFDLAATMRTLHHIARPELVIAEMTRVTRLGGALLVVDHIAPVDPLGALELNRFERARDPSTSRVLADVDLCSLFDANDLVLERSTVVHEQRDVERYLDLAGCEGQAREQARAMAPPGYTADIGWYLLRKPLPR